MHLEKVYNVIPKLRSESISFQQLKESGSEHHDDAGTIKYHIHKCTNKLKRHETGGLKRRLHLAQAAEIIVWCSLRLSRERFKNNPADFISLRCVMENVGSRLFRSLTHSRELKMRSSAAKTWLLFLSLSCVDCRLYLSKVCQASALDFRSGILITLQSFLTLLSKLEVWVAETLLPSPHQICMYVFKVSEEETVSLVYTVTFVWSTVAAVQRFQLQVRFLQQNLSVSFLQKQNQVYCSEQWCTRPQTEKHKLDKVWL